MAKKKKMPVWGLTRLTPREEVEINEEADNYRKSQHDMLVATGQVVHIEKHPKK
jgi:hypothetical protein